VRSFIKDKDIGKDCESIISSLIERHQNHIVKEEFSKNDDGQRGDYLPEEILFIKKSFANLI